MNVWTPLLALRPGLVDQKLHVMEINKSKCFLSYKDLDSYKAYAKEEILNWLALLRKCGIANDWLVVVVECADSKKTNKLLPRTSVLDKVKTDTATRQPDRCISLIGNLNETYLLN